jgi:hypothetical protein
MKTLLTAALSILLASTVYAAGESVHLGFTYDDQDIPEYAIQTVGIKINGTDYCQTSEATTNADGEIEYICADEDFAPGEYSFQLFLILADSSRVESQVVMGTVPEPPVVLPPPNNPVIIRGRIERDGEVIYEMEV